jgi:competence protein ComEC
MKRLYLTAFLLVFCLFFTGTEGNQNETEIGSPISEIRFLDVGQGDCALLRTPQGDILIDAGTEESQSRLCLRLAELGVKELAIAVFTHNDEDHIGGADGVLSQIPTREIWVGDTNADNESAERLFQVAAEKGISVRAVRASEIHHVGDLTLTVLHPFPFQAVEGNEGSVVLKIHYRGVNLIFAGDVGSDGERKIAERYGSTQLDCDLLKIAHHGSNTSTSDGFLQATTPHYAVISCGAGNAYGHPMGEVLARLERHGITTLRTDLEGEIVFVFDGETLRMQ